MMILRNLVCWDGKLGRLPYVASLGALVALFFVTASMFPSFVIILIPVSYVACCLLANRVRDTGLPVISALLPFVLVLITIILNFTSSFLSFGQGGSSASVALANKLLPWLLISVFLLAGCIPSGLLKESGQPL
jgi:uncharacterized membrane protein YhaH (DUF805 family)